MLDQIALVTGAAGGIGAAVVRNLASRGVIVAAVDCDQYLLAEVAGKVSAEGVPVFDMPADVTDRGAVGAVVDRVERELGPLDFLVNAAGVLRPGPALELSEKDWTLMFAVNATGVFHMSRAVVDRMVPRGRGAVVTVTSNAACTARLEMSAYAASKAAASMFTKCLGLEVAKHGIRCNLVAPGSTETPMLTSMWRDAHDRIATIKGNPDSFRVGIPLGQVASPDDVAEAVAFLLSDQARHITMHDLTVDGGATLGV
jgi:2,3-dihydro-2,3-dihydroxybenzoate dehydrogenase